MPLASGADVAIGAYEFNLATDVDEPCVHYYENLYGDGGDIEGTEGKKAANKNILFWSYDNFIGGDGLSLYDLDQSSRWYGGTVNPRGVPGSLQAVPTRAQTSQTTSVTPTFGGFTSVAGNLWYFTGEQGFFSTDNGATWTENADVATELPASYQITAVCDDGEFPYFAASDGTNRGIWRCDSTTVATDVVTAHASTAPYRGIAVRDGFLYAWTGGILLRYKLDILGGTLPITHSATTHRVYRPNVEAPSGTIYADIRSSDNITIMMRSYDGFSQFFEWKLDPQTNKLGGRKFWTMVDGFTAKKFCIHSGVLFVLGDYQDKLALWGYSLVNKQPLFLGYLHEDSGLVNTRFIVPSYGAQVLIGVDDGTSSYIYVYDAEEDAFSELDRRIITGVDGTLLAGVTSRRRRVTAHFATTTTKFNRWSLDTDASTSAWDWTSSAYDFGYPQDEKVLLGFHVVQDPSYASGTVNVDYQLDEDASWVDAGTTSAAAKHTYIQVSDGSTTKKFRTLRMRMTGAAGVAVFSITARAYINTRQELWKLAVDVRNQAGNTRKPSNKSNNAQTIRDQLHTLVSNGNVVTFKDGRRRNNKSSSDGFTTHTCIVEYPKDAVDSGREGVCEVILRSVAPSAS
jgi:hypothetical protein